jgi:3-deoxy-D-manno-octulosonic acid (KDO) 8-phosphate synthase
VLIPPKSTPSLRQRSKLLVIAGPCVIESETLTLTIAEAALADIARELPSNWSSKHP